MTEKERESLAEATATKVIHALRTDKKSFWIQPEEHYNHHKRLSGWFGTLDWGAHQAGKVIIGILLMGILGLIVFGYNRMKF